MKQPLDLVVVRYKESLEWVYDIRKYFSDVFVYNREESIFQYYPRHVTNIPTPNVGREAGGYLYHMYTHAEKPTMFLQGNPFVHLSIAHIMNAIENYSSGFMYLTPETHVSDAHGNPHHAGLPIGAFWEDFTKCCFDATFPNGVSFSPGAQFVTDTFPSQIERLILLCDQTYKETYPWVLERLWKPIILQEHKKGNCHRCQYVVTDFYCDVCGKKFRDSFKSLIQT